MRGHLKGNKYRDVNTYYLDEIKKLKSKNIRVHAFYVRQRAKSNFEEIASLTNGVCKELKINSSQGSEDLVTLINLELLNSIGGSNNKTLTSHYITKFKKNAIWPSIEFIF